MNKLYKEEDIQAIGNAIRTKGGTTALLKVEDMAQAIADIPEPTGTQTVTENGTYNISDKKYVAVNVPTLDPPTGTFIITSNGTYDISDYASVVVNVSGGSGESVVRDSIVIPDIYNTGVKGTLTPQTEWKLTETTGLVWYSDGKMSVDFNNGKLFRNLSSNTEIIIENVDFSEGGTAFELRNVNRYDSSSAYYRTGMKIHFKNCRFCRFVTSYPFNVDTDTVEIIFDNCSFFGSGAGNATYNNCQFGNATWWRANYSQWTTQLAGSDVCNPKDRATFNNCYFFDCEDNFGETPSGSSHIDGMQTYASLSGLAVYNCRFECVDMPFHSQGGWSYSIYWENENINSSIDYTICNGGGNYGLCITKADNQTFSNNQVSHFNDSGTYYWGSTHYQEEDNIFTYTENLYVSSIFTDDEHINIVYSNDTQTAKTLTVKVNGTATHTFNVGACPKRNSASWETLTQWSDLPIDKVAVINKTGVTRIECYDGDSLIRTYNA